MPAFGVAGYLLVALLIVAESLMVPVVAGEARYALAGVTGFGFLYSLYLEYLQGFVLHAFCAWCVTSGIVMTALFALAVYNVAHPELDADASAKLAQIRRYFVVFVAALMIGVPAFYELATHGEVAPPPPPAPNESTEARLVRPDSHATGNVNAPVTVVEFGDFECPVCGREEPVAKQIRAKYANQIRFVFRQFPLIHTHPFAQRLAEASECAADQGKFWEAVDTIYSHQDDLTEDRLTRDAAEIGLDPARFKQCMDTNATTARVNRDREDGKALGVNATPTFFVGRQVAQGVPDIGELSRMIDHELAALGTNLSSSPTPPVDPASIGQPAKTPAKNPAQTSALSPATASSNESATGSFGLLGPSPASALTAFQTGVACSEDDAKKKQPTLVNTGQLREILAGNPHPLFVDVRSAKEYAAGNIPGSINIPIDDMPTRWNTIPKDRVIIFYESGKSSGDICASGRAAGRILLQNGYAFDHVKVYQDGLAGWQKSGLSSRK
jgi:protein-disulfide isomerase/rhodanese-related sulfurtransferase